MKFSFSEWNFSPDNPREQKRRALIGSGKRGPKSPAHRAALSRAMKGRKASEETRRKLSIAHRKPCSEARRLAIIAGHAGRDNRRSEATRAKMRAAWALRRADKLEPPTRSIFLLRCVPFDPLLLERLISHEPCPSERLIEKEEHAEWERNERRFWLWRNVGKSNTASANFTNFGTVTRPVPKGKTGWHAPCYRVPE